MHRNGIAFVLFRSLRLLICSKISVYIKKNDDDDLLTDSVDRRSKTTTKLKLSLQH